MSINRRIFVALVAAVAGCGRAGDARGVEERGLLWRVETRDGAVGIIFGYEAVAASVAPEVVQDGLRTVGQARRVVVDVSNYTLPTMTAPNEKLPPVLPGLSAADADDLREIATALGIPAPQIDRMPGILYALLLYGEGQSKPEPSVAGVIVERAKALGSPVAALLTQRDIEPTQAPLDLVTVNATIDEKKIAFLLDVRRQVGPIGIHCENLYRDRKAEELNAFRERVSRAGAPVLQTFFNFGAVRPVLLERFSAALAASSAKQPTLFLLSLGLLTGPEGLLDQLRAQGARITVLA
jgi:hypothetical protein